MVCSTAAAQAAQSHGFEERQERHPLHMGNLLSPEFQQRQGQEEESNVFLP